VRIPAVQEGFPADRAGVRAGDIVTHVNGERTPTTTVFRAMIGNRDPGEQITLRVWREGRTLDIPVTLSAARVNALGELLPLGVDALSALTENERRMEEVAAALSRFGVSAWEDAAGGVRVANVRPGSDADDAGYRMGDTLIAVRTGEGRPSFVRNRVQLFDALSAMAEATPDDVATALVVDDSGERQDRPLALPR